MFALFTSSTSLGGWVYLLTAIVLNAIFVTMAFKIWVRDEPEAEADNFKVERNFFRYSLMYLFLQFGSILVDLGLGTNFSWGFFMNFGAEHELHKRRMSKNIGLGIILVTFVALIFGLTVVKVTEGDVSGAIVGAASNE